MSGVGHVPVSGMGCICGAGLNLPDCMSAMLEGRRAPRLPAAFPVETPAPPVFEVPDPFFDVDRFPRAPEARVPRLALTAVAEALQDAGISVDDLQQARVGVCLGTNVACSFNDRAGAGTTPKPVDLNLSGADRFLRNNPTLAITRAYHLNGPSQTVVNACSAGTDAIGIGSSWIAAGLCDIVIAGGVDALYLVSYLGFKSLLISDNHPCRPFDRNRGGLNLGEGAAVMVLERPAQIRARGKKPRAVIMGYGASADAHHLTMPDPTGNGLILAIEQALASGGVVPEDIAFINAHGTGTLDNDLIESRVFQKLFSGTIFYSTKGYTGHTLGAAGAIEAVFTAASLEQGRIPPSAGFETFDPELGCAPVESVTAVNGAAALTQTLAFGGNNAVLAIGRSGS